MSKRGLGKGLDALLSTSSFAREKQHIASHSQELSADGELTDLAIGQLQPGVYQPRKDMAPEALEELAASIQSQGIIQPIVVRQVESGQFEIIAGERRWRAARQAGLKRVPCLVKKVEDRAAIAMALIENIQREDLNVIEEAQALERLQDEFTLTHQQVAEVIGKSRTTVSNLLRLNQLESDVKSLVADKLLEMGHARALLALQGEKQVEVAQQVAKKQMTVRQTEQLVKKCLAPQNEQKGQQEDTEAEQMSHKLSQLLDAKVSLTRSANGKAKLTISLDEPHKLDQLIAKLEA
ncbi:MULTISPECIES: ParB/RepB/Spo0J family partition protein [Vibrio]|jgi:ParB family chromosome partitioning protein|uniref:Chromosome (Plasmid) partitioning protein ParB/stage 0 sporulation protein J n=2 Tax=Vibrio diabolicus subgroup TaxID=2315253 RepID=A0ACA6QIN9_VIBAE|nr:MULTISPECIES: ParB/RepB/Spo0J family partition protein [Vibrio]MCS0027788.1 ParB/RepB/Spo0J family partition protein [Vibrio alginolyticus]ACY50185.1 chromosome (plasmid) partitioning protein ParB/stage 0 sporulation protein J [Vibrio antiquarius]MCE9831559.1 ParB/RepB/Spo0J family partition protein [Vibrio diabolicus]MCF7455812.1 ParB/RepB/Spo0J family partition protein [Vibrio sp. A1-1]MCG9622317.1 ParB/RepB/Spo0J family partition protein [Vibrio diabolicus]